MLLYRKNVLYIDIAKSSGFPFRTRTSDYLHLEVFRGTSSHSGAEIQASWP